MSNPNNPFATPSEEPAARGLGQPAQPAYEPPPFGEPAYGSPGGFGAPPGQARNGLGIAALVCGLIALVTCFTLIGGFVLGTSAVVLGALGRGRAKRVVIAW